MISKFFKMIKPPVRVALLSDLHDQPCPGLLDSLRTNRPDIICITGDFILGLHPDSRKAQKRMRTGPADKKCRTRRMYAVEQIQYSLRIMAACAKLAPTFVSLGNHDWMFTNRELHFIEKTGVTLLDNSWVRVGSLVVGGLTSAVVTEYRYYLTHPELAERTPSANALPKIYPDRSYTPLSLRPQPELKWLKDFCAQPGYKILLCHHPEYRDRYLKDLPIDLILCGHAHGGQIRIAGQGLFAPGQGFLPRYTSGVHGNMVISRGLANTARFIPRLGNPTEVVYLI